MNIKTTLILASTAVALLASPASARYDGDSGGASAFARFHDGPQYRTDGYTAYASGSIVQPRQAQPRVQRPHRVRNAQPQR
jgi:hypothetical protein